MRIETLHGRRFARSRTRSLLGCLSALLLMAVFVVACGDATASVSDTSSQVIGTSSVPSLINATGTETSGIKAEPTPLPTSAISAPAISAPAAASSAPANPFGPPNLDERIFFADVIAIVRPVSEDAGVLTVERDGRTYFSPVVQSRLEVIEYLKGDGTSEIIVDSNLPYSVSYTSTEQAIDAAESNVTAQRRDLANEEGVIFLQSRSLSDSVNILDTTLKTNKAEYIQLESQLKLFSSEGKLDSLSSMLRVASESGQTDDGTGEFSVGKLREAIKVMDAMLREGGGIEGYEECVREMLLFENFRRKYKENLSSVSDVATFDSGLPANSVVHEFRTTYHRQWFTGDNASLFHYGSNEITVTRPLPVGAYKVNAHFQEAEWVPCNYIAPPRTWRYTFESAADVLHEAFFDPVDTDVAVGADADNGALKPNTFQSDDGTEIGVERIDWQDSRVEMKLSSTTALSGNRIDLIILDGSVSLRLDFGDATKTTEGDAVLLTWAVCGQPWESGDLLMLRIAEGMPDDGVAATADEECSNDAAE